MINLHQNSRRERGFGEMGRVSYSLPLKKYTLLTVSVSVAHPLLSIWPSSVFSTQLDQNSFCNWIRILFLVRIWGSLSPIYSWTGFATPITWEIFTPIEQWHVNVYIYIHCQNDDEKPHVTMVTGIEKNSSTVDWRWKAPGKPDSNEEKNSNLIPETVLVKPSTENRGGPDRK